MDPKDMFDCYVRQTSKELDAALSAIPDAALRERCFAALHAALATTAVMAASIPVDAPSMRACAEHVSLGMLRMAVASAVAETRAAPSPRLAFEQAEPDGAQ